MSKSTISISFAVEDGKDGFKKLTLDAAELRKVMQGTVKEAQTMKKRLVDIGAMSFGIDAITGAVNSLQGVMKGLTDAYAIQVEAETKLETVMRQRMSATEGEIQAIKDLCSAQQQLGVIGDEVQLAGAQQISTFLSSRAALETLIPAMNNLVAQQKGLNATSGDAVTVGNLLGKAMQGQVDALRRVGITFTEAEKKAVKFGTEEERAAALAQIITNNVGEMNAALAKTSSGKIKQLENTIGDLKEVAGAAVKGMQPYIAIAAQVGTAYGNIKKLTLAMAPMVTWFAKWTIAINGTTTAMKALQIATRVGVFGGIAIAVGLLYKCVSQLNGETQELATRQKMVNDIGKEAAVRAAEQRTEIDLLVKAAKNEKLSLDERHTAISRLNKLIPDYNASLDKTTGKYKENTKALNDYIKGLVRMYEIEGAKEKLAEIGRRKAEARTARQEAIRDFKQKEASVKEDSRPHKGGVFPEATTTGMGTLVRTVDLRSSYGKVKKATSDLNNAIKDENAILKVYGVELQKNAVAIGEVSGSVKEETEDKKKKSGDKKTPKPEKSPAPEGSMADIEGKIKDIEGKISYATDPAEIVKLERDKSDLEKRLSGLRIRVDYLMDRDKIEEVMSKELDNPLKMKIKVDAEDLKNELLDIPEQFKKSQIQANNLAKDVDNIANLGRSAASAFSSLGDAMEAPMLNVAGIIAGAIANIMAGFAAASAKEGAQGSSPWEWIAFAVSGLATAVATVAQIKQVTAFADGGIVSGPTMALVGEYAGARNNPEVIAPLNKLRDLIGEPGGAVQRVEVFGRIKGSDIELVQRNYSRVKRVSGRKV